MGKLGKLIWLAVPAIMLVLACGKPSNMITNQETPVDNFGEQALINLPAGTVIESATFSINVYEPSGQTINVHRVTAPWVENTVTWNSLGGSYDPAIIGSFVADGTGRRFVDVKSLVQGWVDGLYPDYGILLEQGATTYTVLSSSEWVVVGDRPRLDICYSIGGFSDCITIQRGVAGDVQDSYILENLPDLNGNGAVEDILYTGLINGWEKQALVQFDYTLQLEPAAIGDRVWYDNNMNGIQDDGELGAPDVVVQLLDCDGNVLDEMLTDIDGYYLFSGLVPGNYLIRFFPPEGYMFTYQDQGNDDAVDSDADQTTGVAWCTTLEPGETDLTWDAGLFMVPQDGCTLTIGYWKTHAGFGPQPDMVSQYLPIWLGTADGDHSLHVINAGMAVDVLKMFTYGVPSNGITRLYAQLLGAKLNIANGADYAAVAAAMADADAFLAAHFWTEWDDLSRDTKKTVVGWQSLLDDYNNGIVGPGHCD